MVPQPIYLGFKMCDSSEKRGDLLAQTRDSSMKPRRRGQYRGEWRDDGSERLDGHLITTAREPK